MDRKLIDFAEQAGFPVNEEGGSPLFSVKKKVGLFGFNEVELDSKIQKLADLLFDDFVTQWWVQRHGTKIEKP